MVSNLMVRLLLVRLAWACCKPRTQVAEGRARKKLAPSVAVTAVVERRREIARKASTEIVYLITSLPPEAASPQRLLRLARDHWGIENRLHYVRDVAFAEDRCRVRAGARPLASLRNFAITLIRRAGLSISEARENFREDRANAITLVTGRVL